MAGIFSPVILVLAFPFSFFLVLAICAIQPMREAGTEPCLSMRMALVLLFEFGAVCGGNVLQKQKNIRCAFASVGEKLLHK